MIVARFALVLALAPHAQVADTGHRAPLPGMPPGRDSANIYAAIGAGMLDSVARRALPLVYVPLGGEASVAVIDPHTFRVLRKFETGALPQHVVPAYDLRTLWVANDLGNTLTPIDPETGKAGKAVRVVDPYNLYFTPDGRYAVVVAERLQRLDFRDPHTFRVLGFIRTGMGTHGIYPSRDGQYLYVTNRGAHTLKGARRGRGSVSVLDPVTRKVVATWPVPRGGSPDMGNVSADGTELWLSGRFDQEVYVFDTKTGRLLHRIPVGRGPHGLTVWPQPGRDSLGHTGNMR